MNEEEARAYWERAQTTLASAKLLLPSDPDRSASSSYYASFYAVSALFALDGKSFSKHSALETAVHRDLIKTGKWPKKLGEYYSSLIKWRNTGDYGVLDHITGEEAEESIQVAEKILAAVADTRPDIFSPPEA